MYFISATEAISPAIERTRNILFRPFRWGTYLKLCLVALITEGVGLNFNSSGNRHHASNNAGGIAPPFVLTPGMIAAAAAAVALAILLALLIGYLITRLRFAFFHCLIHNTREIRPGWELYRTQAARFFWMNVAVGVCFVALAALVLLPFAAGVWRLVREHQLSGHIDVGLAMSVLLPLIPIILLLILAGILFDVVLRDWMLPHYALENATAGQAWSAVWARMSSEKGPFFFYAVLRILLPIAAVFALIMIMIIPGILFVATVAGLEFAIHSIFTGPAFWVGILFQALAGVIAVGVGLLVYIALGGPVSTAVREYALLFYGGRYQPLGDILFPPAAGAPSPGTA